MIFFISGIMQGSKENAEFYDQEYRILIKKVISKRFNDVMIFDPFDYMLEKFSKNRESLINKFNLLNSNDVVERKKINDQDISVVIDAFLHIMSDISKCDILIAYLPDRELSMGTAMEIWEAKKLNKFIIVITKFKNNLSILSCADLIVSSIELLEKYWERPDNIDDRFSKN